MSNQILDALAYQRSLNVRDLTDAALGPHAIQFLVHCAIEALRTAWQCPVVVHRAPPVVTIAENYDDLLYPAEGSSRDARYTRYVSEVSLLRTQTSAMIPRVLPVIRAAGYSDVLIACPGLTYRRDSIDRLHVGEPHQLDLWRVQQGRSRRRPPRASRRYPQDQLAFAVASFRYFNCGTRYSSPAPHTSRMLS